MIIYQDKKILCNERINGIEYMKCKICGAMYDSNLDYCPYCHSENDVKSNKKLEEELKGFDEEIKEIHKLPNKISAFSVKIVLGIVLLLSVIIVFVVLNSDSLFSEKTEIKEETVDPNASKHIEKLEEMLEDKDYEGIKEYISEEDIYEGEYSKYIEVSDAIRYYNWMILDIEFLETVQEEEEYWGIEQRKNAVYSVLHSGLQCMYTVNDCCNDRVPKNNEEYLKEIYEMAWDELEKLDFDKEQCLKLIDGEVFNDSKIKQYAYEEYERFFE